ncbi:MAG TPA: aspartate kinase [Polyangiaceae bacterium]|nr:aspartate kinase [Polyangiaceae bacterium]
MTRIACKFGGSSVADASQFKKVRAIIEENPARSIIVVSAPGKRVKTEAKITDLLYLCHDMALMGADYDATFALIYTRYVEIAKELSITTRVGVELEKFAEELERGVSRDFVASRGEYFNGILMAEYLDAEFVDPADYVVITPAGLVAPESYERLGKRIADCSKRYVMPGFYGRDQRGQIKTFSRGGSDISGAIAARAANAELYENWSDVSGLLMADPAIVENPRPMAEVSYREIRELSYMGAAVFHDEAILPVREARIPICIKNTNQPSHPGTRIVSELSAVENKTTEIAGIAGKKSFSMICVEKSLMNKEVGFAYRLLGIMEALKINVEHCPSSIDGMNVIVDTKSLGDRSDEIIEQIKRVLQPDSVTIDEQLALIAVVGEDMAHSVGIAAKVFAALRDAQVNVEVINQGASELNIIVGVTATDFEKAVRALYAAFVPN